MTDDVALLVQRGSDMQSNLEDLADPSLALGLTINVNKTKTLGENTVNTSVIR